MSDFNSSLPVRTETSGDVAVKIVDKTSPTTQQMTVDSDSNAHVEMHGNDPASVDRVVRTSELGALTPDGFYDVTNNTKPGNTGIIAFNRATSPADSDQVQKLTAITNSTVHALDISLHDEAGAAYSATNPLPVSVEESEGTEVHDYATAAAVAAGASSNHDYTITAAKIFKLKKVFASASGKMKIAVQISPDGVTFTTKYVGFNSTANPNIDITLPAGLALSDSGAGSKVRVIMTNTDNQAQDLYSTISGFEE